MRTPITEMFGIEFPILAFSHCRDVVVAVSQAGGMGVLGAVALSDEQLEVDLAWIEEEIGDHPYGVDLVVPTKYTGDGEGGLQASDISAMIPDGHREFVTELLERYEVPEATDDQSQAGWTSKNADAPFSASRASQQLDISLAFNPVLVANALGSPPSDLIDRCHEA
ncbi:MAG: nitronate monooxygenase, partial [Acidimicrobiales bacterium]|nr:nitronate monooxygenase [Acidimicrobiales bacterium]